MVKLIKNIETSVTLNNEAEIEGSNLDMDIDGGDYIVISNFTGFFQDMSMASEIVTLDKPSAFGLNHDGKVFTTIEISY